MVEQAKKQTEEEEKLRKEIEKLQKPNIEIEYRKKFTNEKIISLHYDSKYFLWIDFSPRIFTKYYYKKTEYQKRKKIIQSNTVSYTKWEVYDTDREREPSSGNYDEEGTTYGWVTEKFYSGKSGEINSSNEIKDPTN